MKVLFDKCGPWQELPNSTITSDTQVITHYGILKLSPKTRNWRAPSNFTEDLYSIMTVHEFGLKKKNCHLGLTEC